MKPPKITTKLLDKYKKEHSYYMRFADSKKCYHCAVPSKIYFVDARKIKGYVTVIACVCEGCLNDFRYDHLVELTEKDIFYLNITT